VIDQAREPLPVVRAADLDDAHDVPRWLVEGLWARAGVGILGGAPKCCKSWLALDLALSVASQTPCLDAFAIHDPGPVMLYMAEDAASVVKTRLLGLCRHRRLALAALPIDVITASSVRIDRERDQDRLALTVRRARPRLLVLDPFVRLHRVDENDAGQVAAVLGYLRALQRDLDVAVLVVHHARKNGTSGVQAGQSLRGSGDLHAWGDSNLYLRRSDETLTLTIEHRASAAIAPVALKLAAENDAHLVVVDRAAHDAAHGAADLDQAILAALTPAAEPIGRSALCEQLRVRNERLGEALGRLVARGALVRVGDRWAVPIPTSTP
jgi:RecA-family ATPase